MPKPFRRHRLAELARGHIIACTSLRPAVEADFEDLLALSIEVLRADLERLGRFDPDRRRARLRAVFDPASFQVIELDGYLIGCIAAGVMEGYIALHSVYLAPDAQGHGIGSHVVALSLEALPPLPVRVEVLKGSRARRFWEGQGFRWVAAQDFDDVLERPAKPAAAMAGE